MPVRKRGKPVKTITEFPFGGSPVNYFYIINMTKNKVASKLIMICYI